MKQQVIDFVNQYSWTHIAANVPEGVTDQYRALFQRVFRKDPACASCNAGRPDYDKLVKWSKRTTHSSYVLKDGIVAYCNKTRDYYTNDNLTDDIAIQLIEEGGQDLFSEIPTVEISEGNTVSVVNPEETEQPQRQKRKRRGK